MRHSRGGGVRPVHCGRATCAWGAGCRSQPAARADALHGHRIRHDGAVRTVAIRAVTAGRSVPMHR
jgi:hypothetical protein